MAKLFLLAAEVLVADHLHRLVEAFDVAAGLVVHPGDRQVREFLLADHVAAADLDRVHAELVRGQVEEAFHDERRNRRADAAIGAQRRFVGGDGVGAERVVLHTIWPRKHLRRVQHLEGRCPRKRAVRADVGDRVQPRREDLAVSRDRHLALDDLVLRVERREEALATVLEPADRASYAQRRKGGQRLLGEEVTFQPEAAADVGCDDADLVFRIVQVLGEFGAHHVRHLRRRPQRELAAPALDGCDAAAGLERQRMVTVRAKPLLDDLPRALEPALDVAGREVGRAEDVVAPLLVDERGLVRQRLLGIADHGQRVVVDLDELRGVFGDVARRGHDERHRFTDIANLVARERVPIAGLVGGILDRVEVGTQRLQLSVDVRAGDHREHAGNLRRLRDVDAPDACVRVVAAQDRHLDQPVDLEVRHVSALADEKAWVLDALDARPDEFSGSWDRHRIVSVRFPPQAPRARALRRFERRSLSVLASQPAPLGCARSASWASAATMRRKRSSSA